MLFSEAGSRSSLAEDSAPETLPLVAAQTASDMRGNESSASETLPIQTTPACCDFQNGKVNKKTIPNNQRYKTHDTNYRNRGRRRCG